MGLFRKINGAALLGLAGCLAGVGGCSPPAAAPAAIRIRWPQDPENLDPLVLPTPQAVEAANLLHCGLLQLDYARRAFGPALVLRLPTVRLVGDSLTLLTYELRPQARWDDGTPVTAQDVAFSLKLMACPGGLPNESAREQYRFIRAVPLDPACPRCFTLECTGQAPNYVQSSGTFPVLSEAALDPAGRLRRFSLQQLQHWPANAPVDTALTAFARHYQALLAGPAASLPGCGPYALSAWVKDAHLSFRRKSHWWADQLPEPRPAALQARPALLRFEIMPDEAAAALALQQNALDLYPQVPAQLFAGLRRSAAANPSLACYTASSFNIVAVLFNTQRPALARALTRQALSRLLDANGLRQSTQLGDGVRTVGLISPADRLDYNDSLPLTPFDPARAAALLRRDGWQRGPTGWQRAAGRAGAPPQALRLTLRYRAGEALHEAIALHLLATARQAGIALTLLPTEAAVLGPALQAGDFDLCIRTIKGNPFAFNFEPLLHSRAIGEGNVCRFGTPASDRLIEAIAAADNPNRRAQLLRRFQALLQAQAPLAPLFMLPTRLAATANLAGLAASDLKPGYDILALHWRGRPPAARP